MKVLYNAGISLEELMYAMKASIIIVGAPAPVTTSPS
jgi:hypothetical protein